MYLFKSFLGAGAGGGKQDKVWNPTISPWFLDKAPNDLWGPRWRRSFGDGAERQVEDEREGAEREENEEKDLFALQFWHFLFPC